MRKIYHCLLLSGMMVFLLSCSLVDQALEGTGLEPSSGGPAKKTFDGQLNIVDQWYSLAEGEVIPYALLVENTSPTLAVTKFSLLGTIRDASGNSLPIMNLEGGTTNSLEENLYIYPHSRILLCEKYQVSEGSSVSQVLFNFGTEIEAADMGLQSPLAGQDAGFIDEKNNYADSIGSVSARVGNQSGRDILFPELNAAAFDPSGKLIGCGSQGVHGLSFVPAGETLPVKFPLYAAAKPASVELFTSYASGLDHYYSGPEPLKLSEVTFTQNGTYVVPSFTVTNTSSDTVLSYLRNYLTYGANGELLASDFSRAADFPPGQTFGPGMGLLWQVKPGQTVSRVVVQVHTMELEKGSRINGQAVTFGPGSYDSDAYTLSSTATNNTPVELRIGFGASCYDAGGNLVGMGGGSATLPPGSQTLLIGDMYSIGPPDDPQCGKAERIEFNAISIHEDLY